MLGSLRLLIKRLDPDKKFICYKGPVPYHELPQLYHRADLFVFASSCENLPIILLEAMASGLPIACSKRGPMPEVLGDAGVYFDPENSPDITKTLRQLLLSSDLRAHNAQTAYEQAKNYTWERSAEETLAFIAKFA